jgi:hypothetical protein
MWEKRTTALSFVRYSAVKGCHPYIDVTIRVKKAGVGVRVVQNR